MRVYRPFSSICLLGPLRTGLFRLAGKARDCAIAIFIRYNSKIIIKILTKMKIEEMKFC